MIRVRLLAVAMLASAAGAAARPSSDFDERMCRNGAFPDEPPFALAKVRPGAAVHFRDDMNGCPEKGAACEGRSYVVAGDTVLTGKRRGGLTCAFFPSRGGGAAGWVEAARLQSLPVAATPPLSAWAGRWSAESNPKVTIRRGGTGLTITGDAYWPSPNPPLSERPGGPNIGNIDGPLRVKGNRATYNEEGFCHIDLSLVGPFLVAGDNRMCGGMNVSFSAVYRRRP